jgi:hypothetical protein
MELTRPSNRTIGYRIHRVFAASAAAVATFALRNHDNHTAVTWLPALDPLSMCTRTPSISRVVR